MTKDFKTQKCVTWLKLLVAIPSAILATVTLQRIFGWKLVWGIPLAVLVGILFSYLIWRCLRKHDWIFASGFVVVIVGIFLFVRYFLPSSISNQAKVPAPPASAKQLEPATPVKTVTQSQALSVPAPARPSQISSSTKSEGQARILPPITPVRKSKISVAPPAEKTSGMSTSRHLIAITYPTENTVVGPTANVKCTFQNTSAKVWVIIHPMKTDTFFVQQQFSPPGENQAWAGMVYFGASDTFELMAVANPTQELMRDQVLEGWPEAEAQSRVVRVIRNYD